MDQITPLLIFAALLAVLMAAYWNMLTVTAHFWDNPKYSHGYLVPLFTLGLLWLRHEPFGPVSVKERWWGVGLVSIGLAARLFFTYYPNITPDMYSFVVCVAGLCLLVGGWKTFYWAWPAVAFLVFMYPLPGVLDGRLLVPLQKFATLASTYCLQTLGIGTYSEGNTIMMGEMQMGVVEACAGLRMLTIFFAIAVAITLVTTRPVWERIIIILSALPIAVASNVIRITATCTAVYFFSDSGYFDASKIEKFFHDAGGFLMMPIGLGLLYVEFQVLSHLVIDEGPAGPLPIGAPGIRPAERPPVSAHSV